MTNGKILKVNALPIVLFTDASLNLIKKGLWMILCYFLKLNNKAIFDYQNIHLLYGSIWKNLDLKGHRSGYNKTVGRLWFTNCGTRIEWETSRKVQNIFIMLAQSLDQRKTAENTVKCQANFLVRLLWSSIGKRTYYTFI